MSRILIFIFLFSTIQSARAADGQEFKSWDEVCAAASSKVADGDLIFLDMPYLIFKKVAAATNTWTSHVGIVFNEDGKWIVAESAIPLSKKTPLCRFLRRSTEFKFEITRLNRPLTAAEVDALKVNSESMLNRFYNLGFDFDSPRLFCSKFVYLAFQSIGVQVGRLETFRELMAENPQAPLTFWKLWFLGSIPWDRRTVTPGSQLNDPKFISVLKGS